MSQQVKSKKRKIKISVVTPTVRPEGLVLVEKALSKQSFKNFEWIVVSSRPTKSMPQWLLEKVIETNFTWVDLREKKKGTVWSLNRDYNEAIERSKGELIVSWQDYTFSKSDTLKAFWEHYKKEPKTLVGAVGNKYETDMWDVIVWKDPREREDLGSFYGCYFSDIEGNLSSVPREAFYRVGGFDEKMDKMYGLDFYNVVHRLAKTGEYDFKLDQSIKSYSLEHGRVGGKKWDKLNWLASRKYDEYAKKQPIKLQYLTKE